MERFANGPLSSSLVVAGVGLVAGSLVGWGALLFRTDIGAVAEVVAWGYLGLAALLPATLLWSLGSDVGGGASRAAYSHSLSNALRLSTTAAVLGALGATACYLYPAVSLPALFRGFDAGAFQQAVLARLGWSSILFVVCVTAAGGVPAGIWAHFRAAR